MEIQVIEALSLEELTTKRDRLMTFFHQRVWGLRNGDVLSTLNWQPEMNDQLDAIEARIAQLTKQAEIVSVS